MANINSLPGNIKWETVPSMDLRCWESEKVRKVARIALAALAVIATLAALFVAAPLAILVLPSAIVAGLSAITSIALWCSKPHPNDPSQRLIKRLEAKAALESPEANLVKIIKKYPESIISAGEWTELLIPKIVEEGGVETFEQEYPNLLKELPEETFLNLHNYFNLAEQLLNGQSINVSDENEKNQITKVAIQLRIAQLQKLSEDQCTWAERDADLLDHASPEQKALFRSILAKTLQEQISNTPEKWNPELHNRFDEWFGKEDGPQLLNEVKVAIRKDWENQSLFSKKAQQMFERWTHVFGPLKEWRTQAAQEFQNNPDVDLSLPFSEKLLEGLKAQQKKKAQEDSTTPFSERTQKYRLLSEDDWNELLPKKILDGIWTVEQVTSGTNRNLEDLYKAVVKLRVAQLQDAISDQWKDLDARLVPYASDEEKPVFRKALIDKLDDELVQNSWSTDFELYRTAQNLFGKEIVQDVKKKIRERFEPHSFFGTELYKYYPNMIGNGKLFSPEEWGPKAAKDWEKEALRHDWLGIERLEIKKRLEDLFTRGILSGDTLLPNGKKVQTWITREVNAFYYPSIRGSAENLLFFMKLTPLDHTNPEFQCLIAKCTHDEDTMKNGSDDAKTLLSHMQAELNVLKQRIPGALKQWVQGDKKDFSFIHFAQQYPILNSTKEDWECYLKEYAKSFTYQQFKENLPGAFPFLSQETRNKFVAEAKATWVADQPTFENLRQQYPFINKKIYNSWVSEKTPAHHE